MRTWHKRLVLAVCVVAWLAFGNGLASVRTNPTHGQQRGNSAKKASISDMRKQTFNFWLLHGPDKQYGGFHATLDRQGNAISPTNKKLVQQVGQLLPFMTAVMVHNVADISATALQRRCTLDALMGHQPVQPPQCTICQASQTRAILVSSATTCSLSLCHLEFHVTATWSHTSSATCETAL